MEHLSEGSGNTKPYKAKEKHLVRKAWCKEKAEKAEVQSIR